VTLPYLHPGLPMPASSELDAPFWQGLRDERLLLQRCQHCRDWQWGPEWICHRCLSFELAYEDVEPNGIIYSYERVWHPVHPALKDQGPYLIVLVQLPHADNVRLVGNLLGDPRAPVSIGAEVDGVFEHHNEAESPFSLLQWQYHGAPLEQ